MSIIQISTTGTKQLRSKMIEMADLAKTDKLVRKGMTDAARIVANAQKNMAPVRKGRVQLRKLNRALQKGATLSTATRRSSVAVSKFRAIPMVKVNKFEKVRPDGPQRFILPGLLKRSIGFRVKKGKDGEFRVVIGANVGKKRSNKNNAPHAAFIGSGTKVRATKAGANRGAMPPNSYINTATNFAAGPAIQALERGVKAEIDAAVARVGSR